MTTNTAETFDYLIAQAREAHDEAARKLADAARARRDSQQRYDMLMHYRGEYLGRANTGLEHTDSVPGLARVGAFLIKLDDAIKQQSTELALRDQAVVRARAVLMAADRKLKSLEVYVDRKERAAAQVERRREQKTMDEYAQRAVQRATGGRT
jgi:flagellar protein FliJ